MARLFLALCLAGTPASIAVAEPTVESLLPRTDSFGDPLPKGAVARLGTLRWKAPGNTSKPAFSHDCKLVAAICNSNTLQIWEFPSGISLRRLALVGEQLNYVIFSSDQKRIFVGSDKNSCAQSLEVATGKITVLNQPTDSGSFAVSANGRWAFACDSDGAKIRFRLIDLNRNDQKRLGKIEIKLARAPRTAISSDGRWACIAFESGATDAVGRVLLIDAVTGKTWLQQFKQTGGAFRAAFSADSGKLLVADARQVCCYEFKSPSAPERPVEFRLAARFPSNDNLDGDVETGFALSNDGKHFVNSVRGGEAVQWDAATCKIRRALQIGGADESVGLAISPDSKTLASTNGSDGAIRLFDLVSGRDLCPRCGHHGMINEIAFHASSRYLASVGSESATIRIWDLETRRATLPDRNKTTKFEERIRSREYRVLERSGPAFQDVVFADNGRKLLAGQSPGGILAWDTTKNSAPRDVTQSIFPFQMMCISSDAKLIAEAMPQGGVRLFDAVHRGSLDHQPVINEVVTGMFFRADGKSFAARTILGKWKLFDISSGKEVAFPSATKNGVAERYFLSTIDADENVIVWNRENGRVHRRFDSIDGPQALSADGRYLGYASGTNVNVIEISSGKPILAWSTGEEQVRTMRFSPDGKLLAVGHFDGTILLWELRPKTKPANPLDSWNDLASADAVKAYAAINALVVSPKETIAMLKEKLRPIPPMDSDVLAQLVDDLGNRRYAVREKATRRLESSALLIESQIRALLPKADSEMEYRLNRILQATTRPLDSGDLLRSIRAIEILERIGTPEARERLLSLSRADGPLAQEALDALVRLKSR